MWGSLDSRLSSTTTRWVFLEDSTSFLAIKVNEKSAPSDLLKKNLWLSNFIRTYLVPILCQTKFVDSIKNSFFYACDIAEKISEFKLGRFAHTPSSHYFVAVEFAADHITNKYYYLGGWDYSYFHRFVTGVK